MSNGLCLHSQDILLVPVTAGLIKMRSRLGTQFMAFFWLIARILTFRDKKYRILTFRDKKYRILTFRNKTESYLTVLQQHNAEAC